MATNHSDTPMDDTRPDTAEDTPEALGIAHLTVVPVNAESSR
jgi:hypothetical protein